MLLKNLINFTKSTAWLAETQTGNFCQKRGQFWAKKYHKEASTQYLKVFQEKDHTALFNKMSKFEPDIVTRPGTHWALAGLLNVAFFKCLVFFTNWCVLNITQWHQ